MRFLLLSIVVFVAFAIACIIAIIMYLGQRSHAVEQRASTVKLGMTIDEVIAVLPQTSLMPASVYRFARVSAKIPVDGLFSRMSSLPISRDGERRQGRRTIVLGCEADPPTVRPIRFARQAPSHSQKLGGSC